MGRVFSVQKLREKSGEPEFYEAGFRTLIEDHLDFLRNLESTRLLRVEPGEAWRWRFNFYGLLKYKGIDQRYRWVILRVNGFDHPFQFDGTTTQFKIPDGGAMDKLLQTYRIRNKK